MLFAWSTDLIHWTKYGDERIFRVGEHIQGAQGVGIVYTEDGVAWVVLEPPEVTPGVDEAGAFYPLGDKIYAMCGVFGEGMATVSAPGLGQLQRVAKKGDLALAAGVADRHAGTAAEYHYPRIGPYHA